MHTNWLDFTLIPNANIIQHYTTSHNIVTCERQVLSSLEAAAHEARLSAKLEP